MYARLTETTDAETARAVLVNRFREIRWELRRTFAHRRERDGDAAPFDGVQEKQTFVGSAEAGRLTLTFDPLPDHLLFEGDFDARGKALFERVRDALIRAVAGERALRLPVGDPPLTPSGVCAALARHFGAERIERARGYGQALASVRGEHGAEIRFNLGVDDHGRGRYEFQALVPLLDAETSDLPARLDEFLARTLQRPSA
jgi:hypothetical protein